MNDRSDDENTGILVGGCQSLRLQSILPHGPQLVTPRSLKHDGGPAVCTSEEG